MSDAKRIRWGIIGPGRVAKTFKAGVDSSTTGTIVALGTRTPNRPELATDYPGARIHSSYEALIADPEVDAIYVATPHPHHVEWAIKAAEGGKHVLCEKPIGLTWAQAEAAIHAARRNGVFLGEAFMYRLHPQTAKLLEIIQSGVIGKLSLMKSSYGMDARARGQEDRLFNNASAGGAILDVGGYPVSMARMLAGLLGGQPFAEPLSVKATSRLGPTGVDELSSCIMQFPNDLQAEISCSVAVPQPPILVLLGDKGRIEVSTFWFASGKTGGTGRIRIFDLNNVETVVEVTEERHLFSFEVDAVADAIWNGRQEFQSPGMTWADTLGNMRALDEWRRAVGLEFEIEKPAALTKTLRGEALRVKENAVPTRRAAGLDKPLSRVALGIIEYHDFASAAPLLDAYFEKGGTTIDTAFAYRQGKVDAIFGDWMKTRGIREECVVVSKGVNSPATYPDVIGKQLRQSISNLKTDYVDVYMMHRDNTEIPVGEFVDAMDELKREGLIRGPFGGSNWSRERFQEAIDYAKRTGKHAPQVLSNNFSLAEMQDPVWPGTRTATGEEWKSWLLQNEVTNFAWSSQARGFFTDRAGRGKMDEKEMVRSWYSDLNFDRRDRAIELAKRLGRNPIQIALAYVVNQPFASIALIGPRGLRELDDCLDALSITLSPEDIAWLERG